ncbi:hypothetical protein GBAR_LOCUS17720 [Geodia barretti]|uniref:Uncharacterized protein n=1 Tax=Geodia barretti TaxID=519541 RepID=A0AA35SLG7_GEOBA|nr:hypothetical protein GBAR_LOCUS17720 [Geodia barretti]
MSATPSGAPARGGSPMYRRLRCQLTAQRRSCESAPAACVHTTSN